MNLIYRLAEDRRGGVSALGVIGLALACLVAAVAIDLGALALRARTLQGAADLAAMSAAMSLPEASAAANATADANLTGDFSIQTQLGQYIADETVPSGNRFQLTQLSPNAVRVTVSQNAPLYFGRLLTGRPVALVARSATAAVSGGPPVAMFSIGSRLLALRGGVANQLLSALAGSSVNLSAMDYEALASADVNLLQFSDSVASRTGVRVGDYDNLSRQRVSVGKALEAIQPQLPGRASEAMAKVARASRTELQFSELIGLDVDGKGDLRSGLNARVNALDLMMAMLEIGQGDRQVVLDVGAQAGLAEARTYLAIGERPNNSPWLAVTESNVPIIRTAQARLYVNVVSAERLSGLARINLPVLVELAASEARLEAIDCTGDQDVTLGVRPGIGRISIGAVDHTRLDDFRRPLSPTPATFLSAAGLVTLSGKAEIEAADQGFTRVRFSGSDISANRVKRVSTTGAVDGIVVSLLQRLELKATVLGLSLDLEKLLRALTSGLAVLGPKVDEILNSLLDLLGLSFGEADVRVHGVTCPGPNTRAVLVS